MSPRQLVGAAREAFATELALYRSLARWITRRPDVPADATPIGYAQLVGAMLWLWIFGSAIEVVVVEVVLRQVDAAWVEWVRLPLLIVGIWGVLWMLGLMASYRVRPHLITGDRLLVRNGARTWVDVPLSSVVGVQAKEHELPGVIAAVHQDQSLLLVGVSSRTNVELSFEGLQSLKTNHGLREADRIGLWVDDPRALTAHVRSRSSGPPIQSARDAR